MMRDNTLRRTILCLAFMAGILVLDGCATNDTARRAPQTRPAHIVVTKGSPELRQYDEVFLNTVQNRWFDLLDGLPLHRIRSGTVIVRFHLRKNGLISDVAVLENTCDEKAALMCQKAILDPSPYSPWSEQMEKIVGKDFRTIEFKFYYDSDPSSQVQRTVDDTLNALENRSKQPQ